MTACCVPPSALKEGKLQPEEERPHEDSHQVCRRQPRKQPLSVASVCLARLDPEHTDCVCLCRMCRVACRPASLPLLSSSGSRASLPFVQQKLP